MNKYDFVIKANGIKQEVYHTVLGSFSLINMYASVKVEIFCGQDIHKVSVHPESRGIEADYTLQKVEFTIRSPVKLSVVINDDLENPLFIFTEVPENIRPDPKDPDVKYFFSDKDYSDEVIQLMDNQTVYIEKGAIVHGCITATNVENIRILGGGILDASKYPYATEIIGCKNVDFSGITIIKGSKRWVNRLFCCSYLHIYNIKVIAWEQYSDGIDLLGCKHVWVNDVFIRNEDDSICIKAKNHGYSGNVEDILIENCVLWNGKAGNALEIGYDIDADFIRNITYRNIDVIRTDTKENKFRRAAISIHQQGDSDVSGVRYENIRVEEAMESLIYFETFTEPNKWGSGGGTIRDVHLKDILLLSGPAAPIIIKGGSPGTIKGIVFENLSCHGKSICSETDANVYGCRIENAEVSWKSFKID